MVRIGGLRFRNFARTLGCAGTSARPQLHRQSKISVASYIRERCRFVVAGSPALAVGPNPALGGIFRKMWLIGLIAVLFCSAPGLAEPTINPDGVRNAASLAPNGTLNSGLAQGSVFVIRGSGLGPQTAVTASSFPLGADLAGASVKISAGSNSYDAWIISAADQQVTALMPSNTPPGDARVTLTYQGQASAVAHVRIVAVNVGLFTVNDAGSGVARAQNLNSSDDQQANTLLNPARPGQAVALRATGVGVASGDESAGPLPGNLANTRLTVYVGGVEAKIRYVGRSDCCAGIDQIVFEVPGEVDGCYVPVAIVGPGVLSTPENATIPNQHTVS